MRLIESTTKRVLAFFISALIIISMLPAGMFSVFSMSDSALMTDITEKLFYTEQATEFTFTTIAGVNEGEMVLGSFTLLDESGADAQSNVKKLEYWDVTGNCYREFYGDFGPADTGFPLADATSKFRVTFNKTGKYTVKAAMIKFPDRSILVSADDSVITVNPHKSELTTDIDEKTFINNTQVEFTYTTTANAQFNTKVLGTFSVLDSESNDAKNCIKKLEYWDVTGNCYREFYGDFGPADTGFPLADATSKFRVTFSKAGTYTVKAAIKKFDDGETLCSNTKIITVHTNNSVLTTDITEKKFEINEEVEFTYTTKANDFAKTMVLGDFDLKKNGIEVDKNSLKLEYWDVTGSCYREFYGKFGPAATGFPLTDATSKFRVTFKEPGKYDVLVRIVTFSGNKVISENAATIEVKDTKAPVISKVEGNVDDWTVNDVVLEVVANDNSGSIVEYRLNDSEWQTSNKFTIKENGEYKFYAKDASGNISEVSEEIEVKYIDKIAPVIGTITLNPNDWTNRAVEVTIPATDVGVNKILYKMDDGEWKTDNKFIIKDNITHKFYVKDILGNENDFFAEIKADKHDDKAPVINKITANVTEWTSGNVDITVDAIDSGVQGIAYRLGKDGTWQSQNTFTITENGKYQVYVKDALENEIDTPAEIEIKNIDKTNPEITELTSTTEKWTNNDINVTGKVFDGLSGVSKAYWRQGEDVTEKEVTLNSDGTYEFSISARDYEGLIYVGCYDVTGNKADEKKFVVKMDATKPTVKNPEASTLEWTNEKVIVTGLVLDPIVNDVVSKVVAVKYKYDTVTDGIANFDSDSGTFTFDIPAINYDGEVAIWCVDDAGNESEVDKVYVKMDTTKPQVDSGKAESDAWTSENVIISGTVSDEEINGAVSQVKTVKYSYNNIEEKEATFDGSNYTFEIPKQNYKGNVSVWCIDNAGNVSDIKDIAVKMDITAPDNVEIKYSESLISKVINFITFGFYNPEKPLTVTISATDNLALDKIKYTASGVKGNYNSTDASFGDTVKVTSTDKNEVGDVIGGYITFNVPAEFKGKIEAIAYDSAGNNTLLKENNKSYDEIIVDSIAPDINITYEALDKGNTKAHFVDSKNADVDSFDKASQVFYNGDAKATITITENNFFEGEKEDNEIVHKVGVLVTKTDNNGVVTKIEYLPVGATKLFDEADETVEFNWHTSGNTHKYTISYDKNADYVINVKYVDFSENKAAISANDGNGGKASYKSKVVTIDKTAPVVTVKYENRDVMASRNARKYFTSNQFAVITVKEHNFRADDFKAVVKAIYSDEKTDVKVADFTKLLSNDAKWTDNKDNTYTIKLEFVVDANYTFDYTFEDLAHNSAKEYVKDEFTVDKKAPSALTVKYDGDIKTTILDNVLNVITFGFYDAKVKVTITANDSVSGIDHFVYSYIKADNVSDVNASLKNVTIESKDITQKGKTFSAEFEIPKKVLRDTNQFNGSVSFTAYDRSTRYKEHNETATIVVDNIAPTVKVTYNEPINRTNNVSYYAGNIEAKIVINEANFYKKDVNVKVNGNSVNVNWVNDNADIHTGTFKLTANGDYVVTVDYTDRSKNIMKRYTSDRLVIDTEAPNISVSDVVNNSANKDEIYGFTITAKDINLDATTFKPTLTAVVLNKNRTFSTKTIPLGNMAIVKSGEKYSFTVKNLEDDAIYTLKCTVKDLADNQYDMIILDDGKEYEKVRFSINRNGSTYDIDKNTAKLIEKYYVQNVTDNVVIVETNADTLTEYKVTVNGKELTKDTDYKVTKTGGNGSWMKYTYSINKKLFANEGEYKVVVSSKDKATNDAFSDVKDASVNFVVDRTNPIVTVTGLSDNGRYQTDVQTVTLIPTDDGGALRSLIVRTVDKDGNTLKEIINLSGRKLEKAIETGSGKITFKINKGLYQNIQILCDDYAVDENGKTNVYNVTTKNVSVDSNVFIVNFWANRPLRWGAIAGVILIVAAIVFFVIYKKRKKDESK